MKKSILNIVLSIILLILIIGIFNITANAEVSGSYQYEISQDGSIKITKYIGSASSIIIPSKIKDRKVTSIGTSAFQYCDTLEKVVIPNSVTYIGWYAFWGCQNLENIKMANSVTSIGYYVFDGCESLSRVKISNNLKCINIGAFFKCDSLEQITIPNGVVDICDSAFYGCEWLEKITIPSSVKNIEKSAFKHCPYLLYVDYKGTVEQWKRINIAVENENLTDSVIICTNGVINAKKPKSTSVSSVSAGTKSIKVKWKKVSDVSGYEVQVATNSSFSQNKKTFTISKSSTTSKNIENLKDNQKYYVRVRTYKKQKVKDEIATVYSDWSSVKSIGVSKKESNIAKLTLYAYGNSLGSSGGNVGHAFLEIKNISKNTLNFLDYSIKSNESISVSIWPDTMGYGGVYINREMIVSKGAKVTFISVDITKNQYDKIVKNTPKESYYHDGQNDFISNYHDDIWHNCTTYSTKMWNSVVPKEYRIQDGFLGVDAPKLIKKKMKTKKGYKENIFSPNKSIDWADVFYVSKKSELVPCEIKTPSLKCTKKTSTSISLTWNLPMKKLLNNKKSVTGYVIRYYSVGNSKNYKLKTVNSNDTTISKLKSGKKYKFSIRAVYNKGKYKVKSKFSKPLNVTTAKKIYIG